jgi:hypothetical protein
MTIASQLVRDAFVSTLARFHDLGLLSSAETDEVLALFDSDFPYADAVAAAASIHVHVKVDDVDALPHDEIRAHGVTATSCTHGYVKYPFPGGINMIFSSIDIAEDDMLDEPVATPMLDHKGIDLRDERSEVRSVFDAVADRAGDVGWRHVPQGGDGQPVYCCHTEVSGKHWVYPVSGEAGQMRPIEFAFGARDPRLQDGLRPPADRPGSPPGGGGAGGAGGVRRIARTDGGERRDIELLRARRPRPLHRRRQLRQAAHEQVLGVLQRRLRRRRRSHSPREGADRAGGRALEAVSVCIDSFTNTCADLDITPDAMHEAVHAAASLGAGIDLVHGVQMQNALKLRGAI